MKGRTNREDIFLRVYDIITEAGTGFAFPSHTIYMGKDNGLDEETGKKAMEKVRAWRRSGQLPFPRLSPNRIVSDVTGDLLTPTPADRRNY